MMAQAFQPAPSPVRSAPRWRRRRHRRWIRANDTPSALRLLAVIPSLPRATLARLTTRLIDRMDELDGDPDLEGLQDDDEDTHDREEEYAYE